MIYFGAASYSDLTIHKDEERKKRYIIRHEKMRIGQNQELTQLSGGPYTAHSTSRHILPKKDLKACGYISLIFWNNIYYIIMIIKYFMLKINIINIYSFLAYKEEDEYKYKYLEG